MQYYGWYHWQKNVWGDIEEEQRVFVIKSDITNFPVKVMHSFQGNQYIPGS